MTAEAMMLPAPPQAVLDSMRRNYELATSVVHPESYSASWDKGHYAEFRAILARPEDWPRFRSNGINEGMGGVRGYGSQVERLIRDPGLCAKLVSEYDDLCARFGAAFVEPLLDGSVGAPRYHDHRGLALDRHDMRLIYNAGRLAPLLAGTERPRVVEIGAGYGGLAAKLKALVPGASIILIDLPEANAIQTFYLSTRFPNARLVLAEDWKRDGAAALAGDFDFAILPTVAVADLAAGSVDLGINIRSMMEMLPQVVADYIAHLERVVKAGGHFYCANRYHKSEVGAPICIKHYPFDARWVAMLSEPLWRQPTVHELLLRRLDRPAAFPVSWCLRELPPHRPAEVMADLCLAARRVRAMVFGLGSGMGNVGWARTLRGLGEQPGDPLVRLRAALGRLRRRFGSP